MESYHKKRIITFTLLERCLDVMVLASLEEQHFEKQKQVNFLEGRLFLFSWFLMKFNSREICFIRELQNLIPKKRMFFSAQKIITN